jgi:hypothetical protein
MGNCQEWRLTMIVKRTSLLTTAALAGSVALATAVFAQGAAPPAPPSDQGGQGMMSGRGGTSGMMPANSEMTRMMDNCNRMMESAMQRAPSSGTATPPGQKG